MLTEHPRRLTIYITALVGIIGLLIATNFNTGTAPEVITLTIGSTFLASSIFIYITADRSDLVSHIAQLGVQEAFADRRSALTNAAWTMMITNSRARYRVLGVANHGYIRAENEQQTREALQRALSNKVEVEILWLDPASDFMSQREAEEGKRETKADAISAIEWFWNLKTKELKPEDAKRLTLATYNALPTCGITWVDDYLVVTQYLASEPDKTCPGLILAQERFVLRAMLTFNWRQGGAAQLAEKYVANYITIQHQKADLTQERVEALTAQKPGPVAGKVSEADL